MTKTRGRRRPPADPPPLPLSALLSQALHAFALAYEADARASLAHGANVLRLLDEDGARIAQLPRRSGVAIEVIRVAAGILVKRGSITVSARGGARAAKLAQLTPKGVAERTVYDTLPDQIETDWAERFGGQTVDRLRTTLEALVSPSGARRSQLWLGLDPPAGTWRSKLPRPDVLPHFPMPRQSGHPNGA